MKLYIQDRGPVAQALRAIATACGCEIVESADVSDEVLCTDTTKALDVLLSGKKVSLVIVGGNNESAETLTKNERFKDRIMLFKINFTDNDCKEMARMMHYWQQ